MSMNIEWLKSLLLKDPSMTIKMKFRNRKLLVKKRSNTGVTQYIQQDKKIKRKDSQTSQQVQELPLIINSRERATLDIKTGSTQVSQTVVKSTMEATKAPKEQAILKNTLTMNRSTNSGNLLSQSPSSSTSYVML